jgi:hypothetical protein
VVHLWVRSTLDYGDEAAVREHLHPYMRPKVELWDATFAMPWHTFRLRVREIAEQNLAAVAGAVRTPWDEIPEGALVLPVDDDDWFHPGVVASLERELRPGALMYRWPSRFLEVWMDVPHALGVLRRQFQGPRPAYVCTTNNYALVRRDEFEDLAARHMEASRFFNAAAPGSVHRIDEPLSIANRTLASQTSLGLRFRDLGPRELRLKLRLYRRRYRRPLPAELAWARPYVEMMAALTDELAGTPA